MPLQDMVDFLNDNDYHLDPQNTSLKRFKEYA